MRNTTGTLARSTTSTFRARTGLLTAALAATTVIARATGFTAMPLTVIVDQIGGPGFIRCTGELNEISTAFPFYSSAVVEDFQMPSNTNTLTQVQCVLKTSQGTPWPSILRWRVSVFSSAANAENSGSGLQANAVVTQDVFNATVAFNFAPNCVSGQVNGLCTLPVSMNLQPGATYWFIVAPITSGVPDLRMSETAFPGGYPNNFNAIWVNPDNGYGLGTKVNLNKNYAVRVTAQ